jgi:hypothetical protein
MNTAYTFEGKELEEVRRRAYASWQEQMGQATPEGWSKSPLEPMALLSVFPRLHLRKGLILRAYQFRLGDDANGVIWVMPKDHPVPDPQECQQSGLPRHAWTLIQVPDLIPPWPPGALKDAMEAIEGDKTPWSYLCASLFSREVAEFGAVGHGRNWSAFRILDNDPWEGAEQTAESDPYERPSGSADSWLWSQPKPVEWHPMVRMGDKAVIVSFYTFCGLGIQRITRHEDIYILGKYTFDTDELELATGPSGFVW